MCGENAYVEGRRDLIYGSPPRVRGKHIDRSKITLQERITPACAGKTHPRGAGGACSPDHPRVCGENASALSLTFVIVGSPPRVRGKLPSALAHQAESRITPACAGKTSRMSQTLRERSDHPRVCGENAYQVPSYQPPIGSPPRVRGKPPCSRPPYQCHRITPACAGKTNAKETMRLMMADHPRVCGENWRIRS